MSGWAQLIVWAAGAIVTLDALIRLLGSLNRRTLGRWSHARAQLDHLAANADIGYFTSVLGAPFLKRQHPAIIPDESELTEYVYLGLGYYVQAVSAVDGRVLVYTVTMRDERLRAEVRVPNLGMYTTDAEPVELTLGSSRLADVPWSPSALYIYVGAHSFGHRESYYLANPGNYQTLVLSWNESGTGGFTDNIELISSFGWEVGETKQEAFLASPDGQAWRKDVVINSYGITAPFVDVDPAAPIYGVNLNDVRVYDTLTKRDVRRIKKRQGQDPA